MTKFRNTYVHIPVLLCSQNYCTFDRRYALTTAYKHPYIMGNLKVYVNTFLEIHMNAVVNRT